MSTETKTRTTTRGIMSLKAGDVVSFGGREFKTIESIRHGWSGNARHASRSIRVSFTDGTGAKYDSTTVEAVVQL